MEEYWAALIGIVGTVLGTVLGWLLNNISNSGKLNVYVSSWNDEFKYNYQGHMVPSTNIEQTKYYSYHLSLDLYNSSASPKIMRNIKILFSNDTSVLKTSIPYDDSTKQGGVNFTPVYYDKVSPINISPKSVLTINLHNGEWEENGTLNYIWQTTSVNLQYCDEKNKIKTIPIKKENYNNFFMKENHENG